MVANPYDEGACQVLPHKASSVTMAWSSADNRIHSESTLSIAPCTPMQASVAWHKPHESPELLPSLSLGRASSDLNGSTPTQQQAFSTMPRAAATSTPSKPHCKVSMEVQTEGNEYFKENSLSVALSKYKARYQAGNKAEVGTHVGRLPSLNNMQPTMGGYNPRGPSSEMSSSSSFFSHKDTENVGLQAFPDRSPPQLGRVVHVPAKETRDLKPDLVLGNASSTSYSLTPGEVANNAYKLYSEMFLPMPSQTQREGGYHLPTPSPEHRDVVQLLPQMKSKGSSNHNNDHTGSMPLSLLAVKQEPDVELDTKPCLAVGLASPFVVRHSLADHNLAWQECLHPVRDTMPKDWIDPKHPDKLYTKITDPKSTSVINAFCSLGAKASNIKDGKPLDGMKTSMSSHHYVANGIREAGGHGSLSTEADWGKFLALSATPVADPVETSVLPCQKRFEDLQAFLKQCDETDSSEGIQALRSLSASARSGYAVELETRAIRLSLEEGKEMKRMKLLNVLGRNEERGVDDAGATPQGPRLPAPGATSNAKNVV